MKKIRIITMVTLLILLISTVCIFAFYETNNNVPNTNAGTLELENSILKNISKLKTKGENVQNDLEYYTYFISVLQPTVEESKYINSLIDKGYKIEALVKIFDFWRYTNEDLSIIEDAYEYKPEDVTVSYWVDEAFIQLDKLDKTKCEYSNLTVEEVENYMEQGVPVDEILAADKISRKGIKTIETILEERIKGIAWCEIVEPVYDLDLTSEEINQLSIINEPNEYIEAEKIARRNKKEMKEVLKESINGEKCFKQNKDFKKQKMNESKEVLKNKKIWDDSKKQTKPKAMFGEEALF